VATLTRYCILIQYLVGRTSQAWPIIAGQRNGSTAEANNLTSRTIPVHAPTDPTAPTESTARKLFALSGNRCAFRGCATKIVLKRSLVGEVCHIKGAKPTSARHDPDQNAVERHGFDNLILLCRVHHKVIDDDEASYPVERLRQMKADHESTTDKLSDAEVDAAVVILLDQSVTSSNQSGGITAHTVHVTINQSASEPIGRDFATLPLIEKSANTGVYSATLPVPVSSFAALGSEQIAETKSVDHEGSENRFVYWHTAPCASLRIVPSQPKSLGRAQLRTAIDSARYPLRPFGTAIHADGHSNIRGRTVIGFDGDFPDTIATRIAHVSRA
jgi:hypothetical protein